MSTKLVLVRHGQSVWNKENRFTGWKDVDLTEQGREEGQGSRASQDRDEVPRRFHRYFARLRAGLWFQETLEINKFQLRICNLLFTIMMEEDLPPPLLF